MMIAQKEKSSTRFWCGIGAALAVACLAGSPPLAGASSPTRAQARSSAPTVVQLTDVTKASGIDFVHFKGNNGTSTILEEAGPGVCVADYDGDGYAGLYFVSGRDLYNRGLSARNALYHNNGDGTFTDVTEKAGVPGNSLWPGLRLGRLRQRRFPGPLRDPVWEEHSLSQ